MTNLRDKFYFWRLKFKSRIKRKLLGGSVTALIIETEQGIFAVDPEDQEVGKHLLEFGAYDKEVLNRWISYLSENDSALVIGGHIGALAIPLSKHCSKVDVIEANPQTFKLLQYNKLLNNCKNINLFNFAAGEKEGEVEFYANKVNSGGSKRKPKIDSYKYTYDSPDIIKVQVERLDKLFGANEYKLVIMDIEGSEYFALQGMQQLLKKVDSLQVEYLRHHIEEVAGTDKKQFFSLLTPHFSKIEVNNKVLDLRSFDYENFSEGCDLVFMK